MPGVRRASKQHGLHFVYPYPGIAMPGLCKYQRRSKAARPVEAKSDEYKHCLADSNLKRNTRE